MNKNVCHFIPYHKDYHSIHTIHFVLEIKPQIYHALKSESVYKMYYVCSGNGFIHTKGQIQPLSAGDVFFTFPAHPFSLESGEHFSYMYISFLGTRGNMIMEKLKISNHNFLFHNCNEVSSFWKNGLKTNSEMTDLISESILLYTFTFLAEKTVPLADKNTKNSNAFSLIKKYIDDNFSNTNFSLDIISSVLKYNKKYISAVFKKNMGMGIIEYLNTIRIQQACTMARQGFTSVNDIAACCGFADPQYFSKVFKRKMGVAPGIYIKSMKNS